MKKHITICADDYGQTLEISQAIIDLINMQRISATSCMVNSKHFTKSAVLLKSLTDKADIGLHFNLTEGNLVANHSRKLDTLPITLLKSTLRLLDKQYLTKELNAQLDVFEEHMGFTPDFIDGHQHVHQIPQVRDVILQVYEKRLRKSRCYVRALDKSLINLNNISFKKIILYSLGATKFKSLLIKHDIPHNKSFSGIYDFKKSYNYKNYFNKFLQEITNDGLLMCHPGYPSNSTESDLLVDSRHHELAFFKSQLFLDLLGKNSVSLTKYKK